MLAEGVRAETAAPGLPEAPGAGKPPPPRSRRSAWPKPRDRSQGRRQSTSRQRRCARAGREPKPPGAAGKMGPGQGRCHQGDGRGRGRRDRQKKMSAEAGRPDRQVRGDGQDVGRRACARKIPHAAGSRARRRWLRLDADRKSRARTPRCWPLRCGERQHRTDRRRRRRVRCADQGACRSARRWTASPARARCCAAVARQAGRDRAGQTAGAGRRRSLEPGCPGGMPGHPMHPSIAEPRITGARTERAR